MPETDRFALKNSVADENQTRPRFPAKVDENLFLLAPR